MKPLNPNRADILLMFTRTPTVKLVNKELEYYQSDDEKLIGFISVDLEDKTYHAMLFDRNSLGQYQIVDMSLDHETIDEARNSLSEMMVNSPAVTACFFSFCKPSVSFIVDLNDPVYYIFHHITPLTDPGCTP